MFDKLYGTAKFPPLPDYEMEHVLPHPDGRAWRKACDECACRTSDPQELGGQYREAVMRGTPDTLFYCVHRLSQGKNRVCGSYAALHPEQARSNPPKEGENG